MIRIHQIKGASYGIEANGKLYVFDGGYDTDGTYNYNFFKNTLGYDEIEAVFLSHYHNHHIGGLPSLITNYQGNINNIYTSGVRPPLTGDWTYEWGKTEELETLVEQYDINYQFLSAGNMISNGDTKIYILNPSKVLFPEIPANVEKDPNDWSMLIILVVYGKFAALFNGDAIVAVGGITKQVFWEQYIFPQIQQILGTTKVTVVQSPHHGDATVAYDWFYDVLAPNLVLMDHNTTFTSDLRTYLQTKGIKYYSRHPVADAYLKGQLTIEGLKDGSYTFPDTKRISQTVYLKNHILRESAGIKQMNGILRDVTSLEVRF